MKIEADGRTIDVAKCEDKINLVFGAGTHGAVNPKYKNAVVLTPEVTTYHGERVSTEGLHAKTMLIVSSIFHDFDCWKVDRKESQFAHVFGLIDLTLKMFDKKANVVWKHPETYLHPRYQVGLGDAAIMVDNYKRGKPLLNLGDFPIEKKPE